MSNMSEFTYREHTVTVTYDSLDHILFARIEGPGGRSTGYADGHSVDELDEGIDDMIDTMCLIDDESQWRTSDHEDEAIDAEDAPTPEQMAEIRASITQIADEFDDQSKTYMEKLGYQAEVSYDREQRLIIASCPELRPLTARSLQRLWHHFGIAVSDHLDEQARLLG
jgi:hypothetical protein